MMLQKLRILQAFPWSLVDGVTGEHKSGVKLTATDNNLAKPPRMGLNLLTFSCPPEIKGQLSEVPGIYNAETFLDMSGNKPIVKIQKLQYVGKD